MMYYRISKYNPVHREKGRYLKDEWTDYSDIGSIFEGRTLTKEEYLLTELNYIRCIIEILEAVGLNSLYIVDMEEYEPTKWHNRQKLSTNDFPHILKDCLRNICWCKLIHGNAYIHFGYDYYVYVGVNLQFDILTQICNKHNLFCEKKSSPYW